MAHVAAGYCRSDVVKTAEDNQSSAIRPEQETSQDSSIVVVLVTTARIIRSRVRRKHALSAEGSQARF